MQIDSDTQLCISLAARPGSFGNRFHNYLYGELHLNFVYRSGMTTDLPASIAGLRALKIRGCGLSMPYKEQALPWLDDVDPAARRIGAVNTILNTDVLGVGRLVGYNTDFLAVRELLAARKVGSSSRVAIAGSGGMAKACAFALAELGCRHVHVVARNRQAGERLAQTHGTQEFKWAAQDSLRPGDFDVLINATPIGMQPDPPESLPFEESVIRSARLAFESVAYPAQTSFLRIARETGLGVVDGFDITVTQGAEQFKLYTGVTLRPDQVGRAAAVARYQKSNIKPA